MLKFSIQQCTCYVCLVENYNIDFIYMALLIGFTNIRSYETIIAIPVKNEMNIIGHFHIYNVRMLLNSIKVPYKCSR